MHEITCTPLHANSLSSDMLQVVCDRLTNALSMVPEQAKGLLKAVQSDSGVVKFMPFTHGISELRGDDFCSLSQRLGLHSGSILECWFMGLVLQGTCSRHHRLTCDWIKRFIIKSKTHNFTPSPIRQFPVDWNDAVGKCCFCGCVITCHDQFYSDNGVLSCGCKGSDGVLIELLALENNVVDEDCFRFPVRYKGSLYFVECAYHKPKDVFGEGYVREFKGKDFNVGEHEIANNKLAKIIGWDGVFGVLKVSWNAYFFNF